MHSDMTSAVPSVRKETYPAVIPVAGRGTRLARLTRYGSKELLPLGDDVTLAHILTELQDAGVTEVVLVSRAEKRDIAAFVEQAERERLFDLDIRIVEQGPLPGNGGAILSATSVIGPRPFLVVWGDEVFLGPSRITQLMTGFERSGAPCIALTRVRDADVPKCGIAETEPGAAGLHQVRRILEKPHAGATASRWASVGGYLLDPGLLALLAEQPPAEDGEVYLSAALDRAARRGGLYGVALEARWFETGSYEGYARAFTALARARGLTALDEG
jgi:UTP--glucose-1-phosphate uridylyltransferase